MEEHERPLILHLLVECAILTRLLDDQLDRQPESYPNLEHQPVGRLKQPPEGEDMDLSFRQACNKIIHSERINFDVEPDDLDEVNYLTPKLYLYGKDGRTSWKAQLEVKDWVRECLLVARCF